MEQNSIFDVKNTYSIFLPKEYLNYKYMLNCTSDYIDLCESPTIQANTSYKYIRVYTNREGFVQERTGNTRLLFYNGYRGQCKQFFLCQARRK